MGCVAKLPKKIHDLGMCSDSYQTNIPYESNSNAGTIKLSFLRFIWELNP